MKGKRRWLLAGLLLTVLAITGCGFLRNAEKIATTPEPVVVGSDAEEASEAEKAEQKAEAEEQKLISEIRISNIPEREETRAKGIYISAYVAGTPALVLRCLGQQESAWDLAKACNTTIRDLLSANQLESEEAIPREKLLLIPRKRA